MGRAIVARGEGNDARGRECAARAKKCASMRVFARRFRRRGGGVLLLCCGARIQAPLPQRRLHAANRRRPAFDALDAHARALRAERARDLFARNPSRFQEFSVPLDDFLFDFSKHKITRETIALLVALARRAISRAAARRCLAANRLTTRKGAPPCTWGCAIFQTSRSSCKASICGARSRRRASGSSPSRATSARAPFWARAINPSRIS